MLNKLKDFYFVLNTNHLKKMKVLRYLISGSVAAAIDLCVLYLFTEFLEIWYLLSAILAFIIAFIFSFILQKYWTFADHSHDKIQSQLLIYLTIALINLGLNTLGIFILVHYFVFHYLFAQIIVSAIIAVESYFVYHYVFDSSKS